ncbi:uncharacterized protein LOC126375667 [Pectinophora gossypiella]|uniref:uncharacterized protein LOC126375667 n=1 Tax=Pectinophora gossypiella TaxID=13191 RepID=UPI00214E8B70|nr:uncharacterized protein LOC126375667 [Pectinophora gossypiella]
MKVTIYLVTVLYFNLCTCEEDCTSNFMNLSIYLNSIHHAHRTHKVENHDEIQIYLLWSNDTQHNARNEKFTVIAHHLGFDVKKVDEFCSDGLEATRIVAKYLKNVINLKVNITDKMNLHDDGDSLVTSVIVGLTDHRKEEKDSDGVINIGLPFSEECRRTDHGCIKVCKSGHNKTIDGIEYETCTVTVESMNTFTIVISNRIQRYKVLYEILQQFDENYNESSYPNWSEVIKTKNRNILLCTDEKVDDTQIIVKDCTKIGDYTEMGIEAALVPKPLQEETVTNLTVLFYDIPYLLPEHTVMYPNSFTLFNNYNSLLKYALLNFIKRQHWNRIAIISDDSPYSDSFEEELVALFREKGVVYSLKQCLGITCDFKKALQELKKEQAFIIIANVGERYAKKLVENASKLGMTAKARIMWIWRGWPFRGQSEVLKNIGEVFSLNVMPDHRIKKINDLYTNKINAGIEIIKGTLQNIYRNNYKIPRNIAEQLKIDLNNQPVVVKLIKVTPHGPKKLETREIFSSHNGSIKMYATVNYLDLAESCNARSYSFSSPCEDSYPLIILLVIGILLLTLIAIFLIFQKYTNGLRTYRSLS